MTIIEQSLTPKSPTRKSEDGIVVTPDFIAVIDGSTSKTDRRHSLFHSNGEQAMRLVSRYIRRMPKTTTCHQFCVGVSRYISRHYSHAALPRLAAHPEERLTASAVVFSRVCREIWLVGDCHCLVIPRAAAMSAPSGAPAAPQYYDNPKPYEQDLAERRAAIIAASPEPRDHFLATDTARDAIIPLMLQAMQGQNKSYAVIDGFPIPEQHVRTVALDFQPWQVVLASDGYPFLCPTLQESEALLRRQRQEDPLNIGVFKATKAFTQGNNSFDDRAYIRFDV